VPSDIQRHWRVVSIAQTGRKRVHEEVGGGIVVSDNGVRNLGQKAASYYAAARLRANRRKSPWNAPLIAISFGAFLVIWYALFKFVWLFHVSFYPDHRIREFLDSTGRISLRSFVCGGLMMFGPMPGAIAAGFMLGNTVFWFVGPVRRIFDAEARDIPGTSFRESMRGLFKVGLWALPIGLIVSLVGAYFLKSLR
jgi:hypothetical protein